MDDEDEEEEEDDELGTHLGGAIENDWSDWRGDLSGAVCLFCPGELKSNFKDTTKFKSKTSIRNVLR